jgi:hypothetical protein
VVAVLLLTLYTTFVEDNDGESSLLFADTPHDAIENVNDATYCHKIMQTDL